ncbi:ATP-binding protein [Nonomuraea sp. B19D2]|uniref:ATP-binding protein n=1 Tax=Nonomuraea sp. B19D2 TaxID=3159561 RepID=UPI0032DAB0D9
MKPVHAQRRRHAGDRDRGQDVAVVFEQFRRLHGDRLRSDRGSGLGLSIVRVITEAHDGTVTATPRDEGGLTITVELPVHSETA